MVAKKSRKNKKTAFTGELFSKGNRFPCRARKMTTN